ncbi:hypothetical protein Leryth_010707 [Lithospermum erythrorhizon]|nr:hypothetical protein Leryth_010707 [Lithospermum erythrorhizon]
MAQLGWAGGLGTMLAFAVITFYSSDLLAACYRSPITGKRNYTYMEAVKNNLGGKMQKACGLFQYMILSGATIGYTITASICMAAIQRSNCFHKKGHDADCTATHNTFMVGMGIVEIILSQIPNFSRLSMLSTVAALMSFLYSFIGFGLGLAKVISGPLFVGQTKRTSFTGIDVGPGYSASDKSWAILTAVGNIAFSYSYSPVLINIQDTLKPSPTEKTVMRKANLIALSSATIFYIMCGCFGYAAFGDDAPGNLLTGFGFYEPFWLVDLANIFIVIHLVGAYQVLAQPVFGAIETWSTKKWPKSNFVMKEYSIGRGHIAFTVNFLRLTWRTTFVVLATILAMMMPFFNDALAFVGALGYWPLTVLFPIEMFIANRKIAKWSSIWLGLEVLNIFCLCVSLGGVCGAIHGISEGLSNYELFKAKA